MANFSPKLENSNDDKLWHLINESSPEYGSLASDELTRRNLEKLHKQQERLIKALNDSAKSASGYNKILSFLTIMMLAVAGIQLILFSITLPISGLPDWARITGTLIIVGALIGFGYWMAKEIKKD